MLANTADTVDRMREVKAVQKSAADIRGFDCGLGVISPKAAPAPGPPEPLATPSIEASAMSGQRFSTAQRVALDCKAPNYSNS
jgi:hypothetical protein